MSIPALLRHIPKPLRQALQRLPESVWLPPPLDALLHRARQSIYTRAEFKRQRQQASQLAHRPMLSFLMLGPVTDSELRAAAATLRAQTYPYWEMCLSFDARAPRPAAEVAARLASKDPRIKVGGVRTEASSALECALDMATGDFIALLGRGGTLVPDAFYRIALLFNEDPDVEIVYSDEGIVSPNGLRGIYKPGWSPEYLLARPYIGHLSLYRSGLVKDDQTNAACALEGAENYSLALRAAERAQHVRHVQQILYRRKESAPADASADAGPQRDTHEANRRAVESYLARKRMDARCEDGRVAGTFRVRHAIEGEPLVSVVIPSAGRASLVRGVPTDLLPHCVRSIVEKTTYANYEIICIDNGDLREETRAALREFEGDRLRRVTFKYEGEFNLAAKMNFGARHARGQHLLFLNDDIEVVSPEWMMAMLEFSQQRAIGAVGAKLRVENGAIQHAGVVFTPPGAPGHVYYCYPPENVAEAPDIDTICNYSAVTGACMMTRRELFEAVGGFDARFPINYNDVDYCLAVRARGRRVVYTPYAELYHFESISRAAEGIAGATDEQLRPLLEKWAGEIEDPYFNAGRVPVWFKALDLPAG